MKKHKLSKPLTWNELADIHDENSSVKARTRPMDAIFEWASNQPNKFKVKKKGTIHKIL